MGWEKQLSEIVDLSQHSSIMYPLPPTLIEDIAKILETLKNLRTGCMKPWLPPHLESVSLPLGSSMCFNCSVSPTFP